MSLMLPLRLCEVLMHLGCHRKMAAASRRLLPSGVPPVKTWMGCLCSS